MPAPHTLALWIEFRMQWFTEQLRIGTIIYIVFIKLMSAYLDNIQYDKFQLISGAEAPRAVMIPSPAVDELSRLGHTRHGSQS